MTDSLAVTLAESAARTSSGQGSAVDIGELRSVVRLQLECTAASVADSLTVTVQTSADGASAWSTVGTFTARTATGTQTLAVPGCRQYIRAAWAISGTDPSFTFSVAGAAHVCYASADDIGAFCLPPAATADLSSYQVAEHLLAASAEADGYLGIARLLPLVTWGDDLRRHVAGLAAPSIAAAIGYQPESGQAVLVERMRAQAIDWLRGVAAGRIRPSEPTDETPDDDELEVATSSDTLRGW